MMNAIILHPNREALGKLSAQDHFNMGRSEDLSIFRFFTETRRMDPAGTLDARPGRSVEDFLEDVFEHCNTDEAYLKDHRSMSVADCVMVTIDQKEAQFWACMNMGWKRYM